MSMIIDSAISAPVSVPLQESQSRQNQVREEHFADMEGALDRFSLSIPSNPSLPGPTFMFGYTHREVAAHRSAVRLFAQEIVPHFAARGYQDLVLEVLPHGQPTSEIELEIAEFNRTGSIGREMRRFIQVVDRQNFEFLLNQAFQHGVAIHSGGVDYDNVLETILHPSFGSSRARIQRAINEINRNSTEAISNLSRNRKRVFSFNGCSHNNLRRDQASSGFGNTIDRRFPGRAIEVDLVIPELSRRNKYFRDLPLSQTMNWERFIPQAGANLVSDGNRNSYLLLVPDPN